jgi:hypothetical protein
MFVFPASAHALNEHQGNVSAHSPSYGNFGAMLTNGQGHTFSATDRNLLSGAENKSSWFLCDNFEIITAFAFFVIKRNIQSFIANKCTLY